MKTPESKARGAAIKARREALGVSFEGFYDGANIGNVGGKKVEAGESYQTALMYMGMAEKFLDHLEQKVGKARKTPTAAPEKEKQFILPHGHDSKPWPASRYMIVTRDARSVTTVADQLHRRREDLGVTVMGLAEAFGLSIDIVISVEQGVYNEDWVERANLFWEFLDGIEQASAPATVAQPPKHKPFNDKEASQKQLEKFADGLCQSLLKSGHDLVTIPWAEFYEVLYAATGCGHFNITLLESIFSNMTVCKLPFLISFGNNVVVICKDALFAPVVIEEEDGFDPDIKQPTTW